jgi:hypothetical protein
MVYSVATSHWLHPLSHSIELMTTSCELSKQVILSTTISSSLTFFQSGDVTGISYCEFHVFEFSFQSGVVLEEVTIHKRRICITFILGSTKVQTRSLIHERIKCRYFKLTSGASNIKIDFQAYIP